MEFPKFSPLMSVEHHSREHALAWHGIRSGHESKKLNAHPLDRTFSRSVSSSSSQSVPNTAESPNREGDLAESLDAIAHQLPFPPKLECTVLITLKDKFQKFDCVVPWMDHEQFQLITTQCVKILEELLKEYGQPTASRFLKSGILKLFVQIENSPNLSLLALERCHYWRDWVYHVPIMALKFGLKHHPRDKLFLQFSWTCDFIPVSIESQGSLRDNIYNLMKDLMKDRSKSKKCWNNKKFLSRKEIDAIFANNVVEALIGSETSLRSDTGITTPAEMQKFTRTVQLKGTRLLAICIYGGIPLRCLHELLQCDIEDASLPLLSLPEDASGSYCEHVITFQHHFVPFDFQRVPYDGETFHRLSSETVVPLFEKGTLGEGGYGEVFDVEIHSDHHDFTPVSRITQSHI